MSNKHAKTLISLTNQYKQPPKILSINLVANYGKRPMMVQNFLDEEGKAKMNPLMTYTHANIMQPLNQAFLT